MTEEKAEDEQLVCALCGGKDQLLGQAESIEELKTVLNAHPVS